MGQQIIPQGNGEFSIFSSSADSFIGCSMTAKEVVLYYVKEAMVETEERIQDLLDRIERGEMPYYQFTKTWEEAYEIHKETKNYEDKEFDEALKEIADKRKSQKQ